MKRSRYSIVRICAVCAVLLCVGIGSVSAQESNTVAEKLAKALDLYNVGAINDGLKIAQELLTRDDLTAKDSIAIYEIMSMLTYSKGVDYFNTSVDYLRKITNIGPCLIHLPRELWPSQLRDQWFSLQKANNTLFCSDEASSGIKTVAVMEFDNYSIGKYQEELGPIGKALADFFEHDFGKISDLKVVERDKINFVLRELELQQSGKVDRSTAVKVGKILGAKYMIFGSITQLDYKHARMVVRVVDVETSEIIASVDKDGKPDYVAMEKGLVEDLAKVLDVKLNDDVKKLIQEGGTESTDAMAFYSKGLEQMDKYNYKEAYELFKKAYELDSTFVEAKRKMDIYRPLAS